MYKCMKIITRQKIIDIPIKTLRQTPSKKNAKYKTIISSKSCDIISSPNLPSIDITCV